MSRGLGQLVREEFFWTARKFFLPAILLWRGFWWLCARPLVKRIAVSLVVVWGVALLCMVIGRGIWALLDFLQPRLGTTGAMVVVMAAGFTLIGVLCGVMHHLQKRAEERR